MERSRQQVTEERGNKEEEEEERGCEMAGRASCEGAGGKHGQGDAGACACGNGIDGHISHSSVSRWDHRT